MTVIEEYIQTFTKEQQGDANELYHYLQSLLPEAEERMSYAMPAFWQGRDVIYFRVSKNHLGLYPTPDPIVHFADELKDFKTSKGAIQLPYNQELPKALIKKIVDYRLAHLMDKPQRAAAKKKPTAQMATFVSEALEESNLRAAYDERPPYQRNDYVAWIQGAKRPETQTKRLNQMLSELQAGDVYMKMAWNGKAK